MFTFIKLYSTNNHNAESTQKNICLHSLVSSEVVSTTDPIEFQLNISLKRIDNFLDVEFVLFRTSFSMDSLGLSLCGCAPLIINRHLVKLQHGLALRMYTYVNLEGSPGAMQGLNGSSPNEHLRCFLKC